MDEKQEVENKIFDTKLIKNIEAYLQIVCYEHYNEPPVKLFNFYKKYLHKQKNKKILEVVDEIITYNVKKNKPFIETELIFECCVKVLLEKKYSKNTFKNSRIYLSNISYKNLEQAGTDLDLCYTIAQKILDIILLYVILLKLLPVVKFGPAV